MKVPGSICTDKDGGQGGGKGEGKPSPKGGLFELRGSKRFNPYGLVDYRDDATNKTIEWVNANKPNKTWVNIQTKLG